MRNHHPFNEGNGEPWEPRDDDRALEGWAEDPPSEEDVSAYGYQEPSPQEHEILRSPVLLEQIATEVRAGLADYSWPGTEEIDGESLLEICALLDIAPESERVLIALEDIGFWLEEQNYNARTMELAPTLEDIVREGEKPERLVELQQQQTTDAYLFLRRGMPKDPIMQRVALESRLALLEQELENANAVRPESTGDVNMKIARIEELTSYKKAFEDARADLLSLEEVAERRERAFRRMHWLVNQDYLAAPIGQYLAEAKKKGLELRFNDFAKLLAGHWVEEAEVVSLKKKEADADADADISIAREAEETGPSAEFEEVYDVQTQITRKFTPGLVDATLAGHERKMVEPDKSQAEVRRDIVMLRRLQQAKAICQSVFSNDLTDRIYLGTPITRLEYEMLSLVRRQLFAEGNTSVLDEFIPLLPGSPLRRPKKKGRKTLVDDAPLARFSGRSTAEIMQEIDTIIEEHPLLEKDYIAHLVEGCEMGVLPKEMKVELAINALKILEKLAYKENHSVRSLVSK